MATVGIVGGSISGNKGAEAMVTTVIGLLKRRLPETRFVLFSPYYRADKPLQGRYPDTEVANGSPFKLVTTTFPPALLDRLTRPVGLRPARLARESRLLAGCDLLVDLAGISFSDGREIYLPFNVLTIWPAMLLGVPVAKLSQAMGPFRGGLNRACARWLLPRCRYLVARGRQTADHLRAIGLDCPVGPDIAFALNDLMDPARLPDQLGEATRFDSPGRLVGVCPSSVVHAGCRRAGLDYVDVMARFVGGLAGRGYRVLLMPHSIRPASDKLKNNDLPVIRWIMARLAGQAAVRSVEQDLDSIALRALIGRCDFFVGSRFHSMVAALAMGVPVMVAGWGHKYFELLDQFDLRGWALDYRGLSAEALTTMFDDLVAREPAVRQAITKALPSVMDGARGQIDALAELLSGRPPGGGPGRG